jgi:hypothetical protein
MSQAITRRITRRVVATLTLAAAVFLLSALPSQAAPRSESGGSAITIHAGTHVPSWWSLLVSLLEKAGARIDDNGSW